MKRLVLILTLGAAFTARAQQPATAGTETPTPQAAAPVEPPPLGEPSNMDKKPKYDSNNPAFRDVAKEFRCPTCTGLSVLESDAGFSIQIKEQVQEQLNLGKSHDQIIEYFVQRYGAWILREPPAQGINALAWIIPITLLCVGPFLIWLLVWKRRVEADNHGVRSTAAILDEMQAALNQMKRGNG